MKLKRSSGILLHISSLPGEYGIGTLGQEAYNFADLLHYGGQKYWQILPSSPISLSFGYSPYSSLSSFAGNFLFINLAMLQKEEWMKENIISKLKIENNNDFINYKKVVSFKLPVLKKAANNFFKYCKDKDDYINFCTDSKKWLGNYALFVSLAEHFNNYNWLKWDKDIAQRDKNSIEKWEKKLKEQIKFHKFIQYIFFKQWFLLKKYCKKLEINIIGDIPIYVNFDSSDTWSNPEIFSLDKQTNKPLFVSGVPPDYFSKTGQLWGNPLYNWFSDGKLNEKTFSWWTERFRHTLKLVDIIRLDHFRGFQSYWEVPASEKTAIKGKWKKGPGIEFFKRLKWEIGPLPLIAEDLGIITPQVEKLRDDLSLPGMKILQFAFDHNNKNSYLPHNYKTINCIVYTGTHDNNTTNGWFYEKEIDNKKREYILNYIGIKQNHEFHWNLIKLALSSIADLSIIPAQDILGYGSKFRMNTPSTTDNNWKWKLTPNQLTKETMEKLKRLCSLYNRI